MAQAMPYQVDIDRWCWQRSEEGPVTVVRLRSDQRHPVAGILVVALLTLLGCSTPSQVPDASSVGETPAASQAANPGPADSSAPAPSPAEVGDLVRPGHLTICSDFPSPPLEFFLDDGTPTGSDVDTGDAIGAALGLQTVWINSVFDTIILALNAGKCDLIISGMFITAERAKVIDFIPYTTSGQQLIVRKGNPAGLAIEDFNTLCGKTISSQLGGATVDTLQEFSDQCVAAGKDEIKIPVPDKAAVGVQLVQTGKADAFFLDSAVVGYYAEQQPDVFELVEPSIGIVDVGIGVSKDKQVLKQAVTDALRQMQEDGRYIAILEKWGLGTVPVPDLP